MPQIVSGLDPKVRLEAFLAGQQSQRALKQQQMAEAEQQRAHQAEIARAIMSHYSQRAKALEDVNARAQMGDAIAFQQQQAEAIAANKPVEQRDLETAVQIGKGITDPKARALWERDYAGLVERREKEKQRQAAVDVINAGIGDGLMDPILADKRITAGEEPETIAKEIQQARDKRDEEALNLQESTEAMEYAQHTLAGLPVGSAPAKRVAKIIQRFSGAQTAQRQKGAGKAFRDQVLRAAAFQNKEEQAAEKERLEAEDLSAIPQFAGGTHATKNKTFGPGMAEIGPQIVEIFHASKTADDFAKALTSAGIAKTPENKQFIAQLLQELSGGAANQ